MSARVRFLTTRFSIGHLLLSSHICCVFLLGIALTITITKAQAAPCFTNAQNAYNYLIAQEKLQTQAREQFGININRATEGELTSLYGIGSSKAQAIVLYREMFGTFKSVADLEKVKGIGPKTIENNRTRLQIRN